MAAVFPVGGLDSGKHQLGCADHGKCRECCIGAAPLCLLDPRMLWDPNSKQKDGQSQPSAFQKPVCIYQPSLSLVEPEFQPLYGMGLKVKGYRHISYLKEPQKVSSVTEVTVSRSLAGGLKLSTIKVRVPL
ncbi:hypothetical protein DSO57_1025719 [Entomophthora muscae]|uniref:Uncharacterized protein n=1 Tax=Entomophthora muscae TaxID=34485 RepID=A0ACC2UD46_9FUNG|nr:hypothetical protein DSO57_1025719 [Entomophthora muscae]